MNNLLMLKFSKRSRFSLLHPENIKNLSCLVIIEISNMASFVLMRRVPLCLFEWENKNSYCWIIEASLW